MNAIQSLLPPVRDMAKKIGIFDHESLVLIKRVMLDAFSTIQDPDIAISQVFCLIEFARAQARELIEESTRVEQDILSELESLKDDDDSGEFSQYADLRLQLRCVREWKSAALEQEAALTWPSSSEARLHLLLRLLGEHCNNQHPDAEPFRYAQAAEDKAIELGYQRPRAEDVVDELLGVEKDQGIIQRSAATPNRTGGVEELPSGDVVTAENADLAFTQYQIDSPVDLEATLEIEACENTYLPARQNSADEASRDRESWLQSKQAAMLYHEDVELEWSRKKKRYKPLTLKRAQSFISKACEAKVKPLVHYGHGRDRLICPDSLGALITRRKRKIAEYFRNNPDEHPAE